MTHIDENLLVVIFPSLLIRANPDDGGSFMQEYEQSSTNSGLFREQTAHPMGADRQNEICVRREFIQRPLDCGVTLEGYVRWKIIIT